MNCRRAKGLIYGFIDGMIGDQDRVALEKHLGECASCESMATSLSKSLDLLHRVPQVQPDENFNWKVRLAIAQARNAMAGDAASERSWIRSWNLRFAFSAVSAFVVVAATGYLLSQTSVVPNGDGVITNPERVAKTEISPPAEKKSAGRSFVDPSISPGSPVLLREVATDDREAAGSDSPGLIDELGPVLDVDSLTSHFVQSQRARYRMRALEKQVEALQGELRECGDK
jgi:hypothetical protein